MKTLTFYSNRIMRYVTVILTHKKTYFITDKDATYTIDRDDCWHLNDDGLDRAKNYFEDPRFDY